MGGMAELVQEGKTCFISLSECSAGSLGHGSVVHPLVSLQMVYLLFSRDAEEHRQIDACKELGITMTAYAVFGRGMLSAKCPRWKKCQSTTFAPICLAFHTANVENNLRLRPALKAVALRKNATLVQLAIACPMAEGLRANALIVPIPGAKSRKHLEENVRVADIVLTADNLAEIDRIAPYGAASGTRYPIEQLHRLNR